MTSTTAAELARKLQLKPGATYWVWPEDASAAAILADAPEVQLASLEQADVAVLFASSRADVDAAFSAPLAALASVRVVWIVYPKGGAADINRNKLWIQLAKYSWRAVAQFSWDDAHSALRIRPLKPGEASPVAD